MRRGTASLITLETGMKILVSTIVILMLFGLLIFGVSSLLAGQEEDDNAKRSFERLVQLIHAQEGDSWQFSTFYVMGGVGLAQNKGVYYVVGFGSQGPKEITTGVITYERPHNCSPKGCLCLYKADLEEDNYRVLVTCSEVVHERSTRQSSGSATIEGIIFMSDGTYQVKKEEGQLDIRPVNENTAQISSDVQSCDGQVTCCGGTSGCYFQQVSIGESRRIHQGTTPLSDGRASNRYIICTNPENNPGVCDGRIITEETTGLN